MLRRLTNSRIIIIIIIRPHRSRSAAAYSRQTFPWTICRSVVRESVGLSSALWKTADRIRMPFGIIGRTGPGMRQVVRFGDRSTGRGTFGGEFGARHCNQWRLYGVCMRQRRDAALFPNYFGQTCYCITLVCHLTYFGIHDSMAGHSATHTLMAEQATS